MQEYTRLQNKLSLYFNKEQLSLVDEAYRVANDAHSGQFRLSGEPYITHPVEVAEILSDIYMDEQAIAAAILHDVLEDTHLQKRDIENIFGNKVAELVDGLSKLTQIEFASRAEQQAENFRKMVLAMSQDIRVILVKLADRLHNMRTLASLPDEKRKRISLETLEIYAPIANRLGMYFFYKEFEELGFKNLYPAKYESVKKIVEAASNHSQSELEDIQELIKKKLIDSNIKLDKVWGKRKNLYSVYRKIQRKNINIDKLSDLYTLRVVVNTIEECYLAMGIVHSIFKPLPGKFKDYIALPKTNGYQSLHTKVVGPWGTPLEIQIKTISMEYLAENGILSQWNAANQPLPTGKTDHNVRARKWIDELINIQSVEKNPLEFIKNIKTDLYSDDVYVFTPKGNIICLPFSSTAIDFAYAVHTDVGNTCVACRINRNLVPLSTPLKSGQTIEIISAPDAHPNPAWLNFAKTGKAISSIKFWLKEIKDKEAQDLGRKIFKKYLQDINIKNIESHDMKQILKELSLSNNKEFFEAIGKGKISAPIILYRIFNAEKNSEIDSFKEFTFYLTGQEGMQVNYASCCYPIPGDDIVASTDNDYGIIVHKNNCYKKETSEEKLVLAEWAKKTTGFFSVKLLADMHNKTGALADLTSVLVKHQSNIENIKVKESVGRHTLTEIVLGVKDLRHMETIIAELNALAGIFKIYRTT